MKLNRLLLEIEGFNQLRLIKELGKNNIKIYKIDKQSTSIMRIEISKNNQVKAFAILEKLCYNYTVKARTDLKQGALSAVQRAGLIIGVIIFTCVLSLSYGFIWRIDITGNEKIDVLTIERELRANGISTFKRQKNIDKKVVRNILNSMDGIVESSVEIKGTTMKISVTEDTYYVPPVESKFDNIYSLYDAEITKIITVSGTAKVDRGDRVFRDAVLIAPHRLDPEGNEIPEAAKGKIYGRVAFNKSITFALTEQKFIRTGRKFITTDYKIFGGNIYAKRKHGFEYYETVSEKEQIFDGFFFPVEMTRTTFYETKYQEITYELDERTEFYKTNIFNDIVIKSNGGIIEKVSHTIAAIDENLYRLNVYIEAEMLLGEA